MTIPSSSEYAIIRLPAGSVDWAGILTQFTLHIASREGRAFAAWAGERLMRTTRKSEGLVGLRDGRLEGILLYEVQEQTAELTFPWTRTPDPLLTGDLARAALHVIREECPDARYIRLERQLFAGVSDTAALEEVGFICHWRRRMGLELVGWGGETTAPAGYRIAPWSIADLDQAAQVVYRANFGTLDALLYAPFFGDSPAQCRKGLLAILAGRYGPIHPRATLSAFCGSRLVGVNLVINEGGRLASVVELSVDPDHQRKNLGRALMVRSLQVLHDENVERVELAVTKENTRAAHLYDTLGFTDYGDFPVCVWPRVAAG